MRIIIQTNDNDIIELVFFGILPEYSSLFLRSRVFHPRVPLKISASEVIGSSV